ncbi:MAG: efflux RND transporter periplasmic adaptor subunit [Candidatus Zixiibacteriota bacterium]
MKRFLLCVCILSLIALFTPGCEDQGPQIDLESAIPVKVEDLQPRSIKEYIFATGTMEAVNGGEVKALDQGAYRLQTNPRTGKPYAMGDVVTKNEIIIKLYNPEREYSIALKSKKLNYDISKREFEKQQKLYEKGGVTLRELTDAESAYINAKYNLDDAELQLIKLQVMAPCDGVITELPYYPLDELIVTGNVVVEVKDNSRLYTDITLPGKELGRIKQKQEVIISNYGNEADSLVGEISQVSPALDPDSRMFSARVEVDNDSLLLRPGMFVKTNIVVAQKDSTIVIPKDVVLDWRGTKVVFIVDKGIAIRREIETGLANRDEIEVVNGLAKDERLVVEGYETLLNRSKVKIIK